MRPNITELCRAMPAALESGKKKQKTFSQHVPKATKARETCQRLLFEGNPHCGELRGVLDRGACLLFQRWFQPTRILRAAWGAAPLVLRYKRDRADGSLLPRVRRS